MELIARNMTVAAIAKELFVSENTVRTHSKHIYTKMDVHSKQELSQRLAEMEV
ncbi:MAG: helix-turn-helix transcriptional regulator [Eggerthellaceae bacterium]|nr:helix-turn-helix transcriptional regulator [Eggerthellaceae bacterium]